MNASSIKDRLKNLSQENGRSLQDLLISYGLERTIYRLSVSKYKEIFILKGGIFYYALYEGDYPRATTDIDFLAEGIGNNLEIVKSVFEEILLIQTDDPLVYDISTLDAKVITEFKEYHGINITITAYLDKTKIPISVDVGFGDSIYPEKVLMDFPVLLSDSVPQVYAYSIYSSLAEKFEAIVSLGYYNSRFKDFYDLYVNATTRDFDGEILCKAFKETFSHRGTQIKDIVVFEDDYANDSIRRSRWNSFAKKKKISLDISLDDTIVLIKRFVSPIIKAMEENHEFKGTWDYRDLEWQENYL